MYTGGVFTILNLVYILLLVTGSREQTRKNIRGKGCRKKALLSLLMSGFRILYFLLLDSFL
jgi:hypothetical protein